MRTSRIGLERLVGGGDPDEFLESVWESTPRLYRAAADDCLAGILDRDGFEAMLRGAGGVGGLSVVEAGVARPAAIGGDADVAGIFDSYARGCSLLLTGLQARSPAIAAICREVENDLLARNIPLAAAVGANAYLTPANSQAFPIHYDNHCAIVVQLDGSKRWTIFEPLERLPVARCTRAIPREQLDSPVMDVELVKGDILYVPRGFPHAAVSGGTSSLHLTLSIQGVTWSALIAAIGDRSLPFRRSVRMQSEPPVRTYFTDVLLVELAAADVEGALRRRVGESLSALAPLAGSRFAAIDEVAAIDSTTRVVRDKRILCVAYEEDDEAVLRFQGGTLRLPAIMSPIFRFIAENGEFSPDMLPDVDADYDARELTRILVRRGIVRRKRDGESMA